jgi:ribonuclease HI
MNPPSWSVPPSNVLKLNVDAALKDGMATLAVVVRKDIGHVINGWAKKVETTDLATVEATTLLWALEIAVENKFTKIVVEADAKLCIDAITIETTSIPWRIHSLVHSLKVLAFEFSVCSFCWVRRDANGVAHSLAKFASSLNSCFSCNSSNLPPSVREAWIRDLIACSS